MNSSPPSLSVHIKTFGCQMNEYDSGRILKILEPHGYCPALSYDDASVIILNTCSVRKKAEDKLYSELGRIKKMKKKRPDVILGVGGCVAQQEGTKLLKRFPYINFVFGTRSLARLPGILKRAEAGERNVDTEMNMPEDMYPLRPCSPQTSGVTAFVTIMQGCNNYCSYCIVPYVRGREWSRRPSEIKEEIKNLVDCGIREVTLLGQNVNSYGKTLMPMTTFPELLQDLNGIRGLERIRFTTSHPKDLSDELITCFKNIEKLASHIHLPLQSGSNRILKKMNRGYTIETYMKRIDLFRHADPEAAITSDIIVGFPGESEKDFNETVSVIEKTCFDDLFVFHYTDRPDTAASKLSGKIPYKTKLERLSLINKIQNAISIKNNQKLVKKTLSVLFEYPSKKGNNSIAGRTSSNKVVNCKGPVDLIGKTVPVKIEKANVHSLNGVLI